MTKRRSHGEGGVYPQGKNTFRIKYRVGPRPDQRISVTFKGSLADAKKKLRELLRSADTGEHVTPDKITLGAWAKEWIDVGAPGRRRQKGRCPRDRTVRPAVAKARVADARRAEAAAIAIDRD